MIQEKVKEPEVKKPALVPVEKGPLPHGDRTKFVELISNKLVTHPSEPFGPGYPVLFDEIVDVTGWKEIRAWVHVFVENYQTTPITTTAARLELRFMHQFSGGSFDYEKSTFHTSVTSYIDGFTVKPILGNKVRLLCRPENLPPGPYRISLTYLLA